MYYFQENHDRAVNEVSKLIHRYPDDTSGWLTLSVLLLRISGQTEYSYRAVKCARAAMTFGQNNMDMTKACILLSKLIGITIPTG